MTGKRNRNARRALVMLLPCALLAGCIAEPSKGYVGICNDTKLALQFDLEPGAWADPRAAGRIPPRGSDGPGADRIHYEIPPGSVGAAGRRPWLPEGLAGIAVRDSATGFVARVSRAEMFQRRQWYSTFSRAWEIRVEPDGDRFRISELTCEREKRE
jgi:hypothetical protein